MNTLEARFLSTVIDWNNLNNKIWNLELVIAFEKQKLKFNRLNQNSMFKYKQPLWMKLLTRLRVGFNHLCGHKFKQNFQLSSPIFQLKWAY